VSKRDDDSQADMEVGMTTAERRRRRRRGGGLRVPSDNVPRRSSTPPVVAPVPEDPALAMSIAYSFSGESSDPMSRNTLESPIPTFENHEGMPTVIDPVSEPTEQAEFEMKTREMTAVDLEALGLSDAGTSGHALPVQRMSSPNFDAIAGPPPESALAVRFRKRDATDPVDDVDVELDSIDSLTDGGTTLDQDEGESADDEDVEESVDSAEFSAVDPVDEPADGDAADEVPEDYSRIRPPVGYRPNRAQTVALSEDDLEEMREAARFATQPARPVPTSMPPPMPPSKSTEIRLRRTEESSPGIDIMSLVERAADAASDFDVDVEGEAVGEGNDVEAAPPPPPPAPAAEPRTRTPSQPPGHGHPPSNPPPLHPHPPSNPPPLHSHPSSNPPPIGPQPRDSQPIPIMREPPPQQHAQPPPPPAASHKAPPAPPPAKRDKTSPLAPPLTSSPALSPPGLPATLPTATPVPGTAQPAMPPPPPSQAVSSASTTMPPPPPQASSVAHAVPPPPPAQASSASHAMPPPVPHAAPPAALPHAAPPPVPHAAPPPPPVPHAAPPPVPHAAPPPPPAAQPAAPPAIPHAPPPAAATGQDGRPPRIKAWFVDLFDEDYLRTLPFLTPQATQAEAEFVIDAMGLLPGAQLLDVGCGYGRHAMELAARGFHVVGLDLSTPLLVRGGEEAHRRGLTINFIRGDMRELDFEAQFDGAYCLFSTFGYFDEETNKKTVANIARALRPGGRLLIEILNRDYVIADLPTRVWWEGDGCVVLEEVELNYFTSRIQVNRSVVFDDGRQLEQLISVRAYSLHEVGKLLHGAGLRVLEVSGAYHTRGRFFGNQSRHIIVLAERKETSAQ
jgi:SAM-dependent methyltransferase